MKSKLMIALAVASLLAGGQSIFAQAGADAFSKDLSAIVAKVKAKMEAAPKGADGKAEKLTEAQVADELKALDEMAAKNKTSHPANAVKALQMKSSIYSVIGDRAASAKLQAQIKSDYPEVVKQQEAKMAEQQAAAKKAKAAFDERYAVGKKFPDFAEKDLNGKPLSIANYKGKVVLVDFWATWCPPCRAEVPRVAAAYKKYHDKGFEIIGISLDRESDKQKLIDYTKDNDMPWPQFFDGGFWGNKLAKEYGIQSIPACFLLDGEGKILGTGMDIRGEKLEPAVAKALGKS